MASHVNLMRTATFARQYCILNVALLTSMFLLRALEALVLRQPVTLASRGPWFVLLLSYGCAIGLLWLLERPRQRAELALSGAALATSVVTLVTGGWISGLCLDTSWDGLAYHQPAIYELHGGWNPIVEAKSEALFRPFRWLNEYPKASWFCSATLLGIFGNVEAAKLSFLLGATAFVSSLRAGKLFGVPLVPLRLAAATILVLNPVAIIQFWQFYIDGILYFTLLVLITEAACYVRERRAADLVVFFLAGVFAANLKFTGLIYFSILLAWLAADAFFAAPDGRQREVRRLGIGAAACAVAVAIGGWSPYLQHLLAGKHLFYPLFGEGRVDIITRFLPDALRGQGWLGRLLLSHMEFLRGGFTLDKLLQQLTLGGNWQIGGAMFPAREMAFGRLFWLATALALFAALVSLRHRLPGRALVALGVLAFFSIANPQAWWSRYVPQLWTFPTILCLVALREGRKWPEQLLATLTLLLLAATCMIHLPQSSWSQLMASREEKRSRAVLVDTLQQAQTAMVATKSFGANIYWLRNQGIPLVWVPLPELHCPAPIRSHTLEICVR